MENKSEGTIIVYGHNFCSQAMMLARALKRSGVEYEWRDVMAGPAEWQEQLLGLANGNMSVPTVVFPDGSVMVEPWPDQVFRALGVEPPSFLTRLNRLFGRRA